jgi:ZIP family zinc transporter
MIHCPAVIADIFCQEYNKGMLPAFAWGFGAAGSLIIGALLASYITISRRLLGLIMAFGVGVLISAVSFELAEEAFTASHRSWAVAAGLAAGALVFFAGDTIIDKMGGRKHRAQHGESGSGSAILLGTILDGIPEWLWPYSCPTYRKRLGQQAAC